MSRQISANHSERTDISTYYEPLPKRNALTRDVGHGWCVFPTLGVGLTLLSTTSVYLIVKYRDKVCRRINTLIVLLCLSLSCCIMGVYLILDPYAMKGCLPTVLANIIEQCSEPVTSIAFIALQNDLISLASITVKWNKVQSTYRLGCLMILYSVSVVSGELVHEYVTHSNIERLLSKVSVVLLALYACVCFLCAGFKTAVYLDAVKSSGKVVLERETSENHGNCDSDSMLSGKAVRNKPKLYRSTNYNRHTVNRLLLDSSHESLCPSDQRVNTSITNTIISPESQRMNDTTSNDESISHINQTGNITENLGTNSQCGGQIMARDDDVKTVFGNCVIETKAAVHTSYASEMSYSLADAVSEKLILKDDINSTACQQSSCSVPGGQNLMFNKDSIKANICYKEDSAEIISESNVLNSNTGCLRDRGATQSNLGDKENSTNYYASNTDIGTNEGCKKCAAHSMINTCQRNVRDCAAEDDTVGSELITKDIDITNASSDNATTCANADSSTRSNGDGIYFAGVLNELNASSSDIKSSKNGCDQILPTLGSVSDIWRKRNTSEYIGLIDNDVVDIENATDQNCECSDLKETNCVKCFRSRSNSDVHMSTSRILYSENTYECAVPRDTDNQIVRQHECGCTKQYKNHFDSSMHLDTMSTTENGYLADGETITVNTVTSSSNQNSDRGDNSSDDNSTSRQHRDSSLRTLMLARSPPSSYSLIRLRQCVVLQRVVSVGYFITFGFIVDIIFQMYSLFGVYGIFGSRSVPDPLPWFLFHVLHRFVNITICVLLLIAVCCLLNNRTKRRNHARHRPPVLDTKF